MSQGGSPCIPPRTLHEWYHFFQETFPDVNQAVNTQYLGMNWRFWRFFRRYRHKIDWFFGKPFLGYILVLNHDRDMIFFARHMFFRSVDTAGMLNISYIGYFTHKSNMAAKKYDFPCIFPHHFYILLIFLYPYLYFLFEIMFQSLINNTLIQFMIFSPEV